MSCACARVRVAQLIVDLHFCRCDMLRMRFDGSSGGVTKYTLIVGFDRER